MRLKTFGGLSIELESGTPAGAATQRRRLALLALIAATLDRGISRDKLLGYLWPDAEPEKARRVLAQALYALRRDLGSEDLFLGSTEIRVNPAVLGSDYADFHAALASRQYDRAVALYGGPFLDGFFLNEAPEFERWVETERADLRQRYMEALELLARDAAGRGETREVVAWRKRLALADPLNSQVALDLMEALVASGDRAGALQHARVYEALLDAELGLPPDPRVVAFADQVRRDPVTASLPAAPRPERTTPTAMPAMPAPPPEPAPEHAIAVTSGWATAFPPASGGTGPVERPRRSRRSLLAMAGFGTVILAGALTAMLVRNPAAPTPAVPESRVVAVGRFENYTSGDASLIRPLSDMLATNLARSPGLQVISAPRMYELVAQGGLTADTAAAIIQAARRAGATELIDGSVYRMSSGQLRLDLRRISLETGSVVRAYRIEGDDLFALAESGTRELVVNFGLSAPGVPLEQVTTRSLVAYRLYEEGLRAYFRSDGLAAHQLFSSALAEDSSFAMAQLYAARTDPRGGDHVVRGLERAIELSQHASDRERLLIRGGWASQVNDPTALAIAETLTVRYPAEPEGHYYLGQARLAAGDFEGALPPLRRVIQMDSLGLAPRTGPNPNPRCLACEALMESITALQMLDSGKVALELARQWVRDQPGEPRAWMVLSVALHLQNLVDESIAAARTVEALNPRENLALHRAVTRFRGGQFLQAERELREIAANGAPWQRGGATLWLVHTLRAQGRLREALEMARGILQRAGPEPNRGAVRYEGLYVAAVLFEMERFREAGAMFDSVSRRQTTESASRDARNKSWSLTLSATARAAGGDTVGFARLADSIEVLGRRSGYGRDQRLHHHVRGLLLAARGQDLQAVAAFRRAIYSPSIGYSRTNVEMARALLRLNRPAEAIEILEPVMFGPFDAANTYVTPTALWEMLAGAYEAAGRRNEAREFYRRVADAWRTADPPLRARGEAAARRAEALQ